VDGRDVDLPLILDQVGDVKVEGPRSVNLERTWFVIKAVADSCDIEYMFLDRMVQQRLHGYAMLNGATSEKVALLLQYPGEVTEKRGVVRHWPNHLDHVHVRFRHEGARLQPTVKAYCDWTNRKGK